MFKKENDKAIGAYLSKLIAAKYKSARQFCKDWLKAEKLEPDDVNLQNRSNKMSQIKNGSKGIQIEDLPIFAQLLGVTCEEILSAGTVFVPDNNRMTNYKVAFSDDESVWEAYINRDDNLILNTDEYDKTVIDYALQFKNFKLLKYFTDKGYIWFVGDDEKRYYQTFSAGTSIERKPYPKPGMEHILFERDELRRQMIALAIENKDFDMLTTLKAREIPTLYQATFYSGHPTDCHSYYDANMLEMIAIADEKTLDYFAEEYEIKGHWDRTNSFMFPFIGELIELLIKRKSKYVGKMIDRCIEHNRSTLVRLKDHIAQEEQDIVSDLSLPNDMFSEKYLEQQRKNARALSVQFMDFYEVENMVSFCKNNFKNGIVTNVIRISAENKDSNITKKIAELNSLYDEIKGYKERVLNG